MDIFTLIAILSGLAWGYFASAELPVDDETGPLSMLLMAAVGGLLAGVLVGFAFGSLIFYVIALPLVTAGSSLVGMFAAWVTAE